MTQTLGFGLIALLITAACPVNGATKHRLQRPPSPEFMAIQKICLLPIVDARAGSKASVNLEKLRDLVISTLKNKHYPADAASTSGEVGEIVVEDLETPVASYIRKLGPAGERWVMVVILDDIASKLEFGSTSNVRLRGYLFDKKRALLVWSSGGLGQAGQAGPGGMLFKGQMKHYAIEGAVNSLLAGMPGRPKA